MNYTKEYEEIPFEIKKNMDNANPYYSKYFFEYEKNAGNDPTYFFDNSQILIVCIHKKLIFRYVLLLTEPYIWSAGVINNEFMDQVANLCKTVLKADWIGPSDCGALFMQIPAKSISIPFGSHVIDLSKSEDDLWKCIHSKHRNVIRKAEKNGAIIKKGGQELLDEYMKIDEETWKRSGKNVNYYKTYIELFKKFKEYTYIYLVYCENELQGGAIFVRNRNISYYLYGASKNSPITGCMNLLHWEAIKECKEIGVHKYSFVGCRINEDKNSKYHGIQRFKERFGGELIEGKMFKTIINPFKYKIYCQLLKLRNKTSYVDIIEQEIHKWN